MGAGRSLSELEQHVGARRRPRRLVRAYDAGGPIELRGARPYLGEPEPNAGVPTAPIATARPLPADPAPIEAPLPLPVRTLPAPAVPAAPSEVQKVAAQYSQEEDEAVTASAFHEDLRAIVAAASGGPGDSADGFLEHAKSTARTSVNPPAEEAEQVTDRAESETGEAESLAEGGHDVFDRLRFANQFDVGPVSVDLGATFDAFDQTIVKHETTKARRAHAAQQPPQPLAHIEAVEDLSGMPKSGYAAVVAERMGEESSTEAAQSFSVVYDVPIVPQQTGMSCWAAGAAMVIAWRDRQSVDPAEIADASGHWRQYKEGLAPEDTKVFEVWGLAPEPAQTYTVEGFRQLLEHWGPLWTAAAVPGPHVRVVAGLEGDGTPDGTRVHILDPWQSGMTSFALPNTGGRYSETYAEYERKQATLGEQEQNTQGIYVAHVKERRTVET